jgi:hypothetical protein
MYELLQNFISSIVAFFAATAIPNSIHLPYALIAVLELKESFGSRTNELGPMMVIMVYYKQLQIY